MQKKDPYFQLWQALAEKCLLLIYEQRLAKLGNLTLRFLLQKQPCEFCSATLGSVFNSESVCAWMNG